MKKAPALFSLIDKAVHDYSMLQAGDRILVGASGGKDSTALIEYLSCRAKQPRSSFAFEAVNIQWGAAQADEQAAVEGDSSGGTQAGDISSFPKEIERLFREWGVPFKKVKVDILGQVKEGHKMNCWWCSTRRRGELLNMALQGGFNKIALGHHLDDILETLLMNALNKGELATMLPNFAYSKYPVRVIRPLCYLCEDKIKEYAATKGWTAYTCTCGFQNNSGRKEARTALEALTKGDEQRKMHLFQSLRRIRTEYLP